MAGIQSRRMFRFVDPASLRMMAMRSDVTPQVGRIAATRMAAQARPLRLCYNGQVLTIKGDGLDPVRERLQLGAELIGSDSVAAAAEVVAVAVEALAAAGAQGISVDFTMPDLIDDLAAGPLPLSPEARDAVRAALDPRMRALWPLLAVRPICRCSMPRGLSIAPSSAFPRWMSAACWMSVSPRCASSPRAWAMPPA
jgi:ATP phosphoribosyltransferase regulatory subunit